MALENNQIENSNIDNDEISLKVIILKIKKLGLILKSNYKFIFISSAIGGILGLTISIYNKPTYIAKLTFAMEEDKASGGGISSALGLASSIGIDLGASTGGAFAASNLGELMTSRLIVEKTLLKPIKIGRDTISLAEYYIQINELRKSWMESPILRNLQFPPFADHSKFTFQQDSILQEIYESLIDKQKLSINQKEKKVSILAIMVTSENEKFSKLFCENLAEETSTFYIQTKSKKSRMNVDILQRQVDSIKNALNGAITGMASASDNVYNLNPAFNIKASPSKKRQIDVQANTAILTNMVVQLELAKINLRKESPLIQIIDSPILPLEKHKLGKLKSIFLGCFLFGVLSLLFLTLKRLYQDSVK